MKKFFLSVLLVTLPFMVASAQNPVHVALVGDATAGGWSLDDLSYMANVSDGVYEWTGDLNEGELKFVTHRDWLPSYGPVVGGAILEVGTVELEVRDSYEADDKKFYVAEGRYSLRLDLTGEKPQLTVADGAEAEDKNWVMPQELFLIGPAVGGWSWDDNGQEMTKKETGIFTWSGNLTNDEMKFFTCKDFGCTAYGATEPNKAVAEEGEVDIVQLGADDNKFIAPEAKLIITVDFNTMKMSTTKDSATAVELLEGGSVIYVYDLSGALRLCTTSDVFDASQLGQGVYILKDAHESRKIMVK